MRRITFGSPAYSDQTKARLRERRKNFLPTLVTTLGLWIATGAVIFFLSSDAPFALTIFLVSIFLTSFFTFSLIFGNKALGGVAAILLSVFLTLRLFGINNPGVPAFLVGIFLVMVYLTKKKTRFS